MKATYTWILAHTMTLLLAVEQGFAAESQKGTISATPGSQIHKQDPTQLGDALLQFQPPTGWKSVVETSGSTKMSYYSPDSSSVLTIRIQPDRFEKGVLLAEKARAILKKRYASATIGMESAWSLGQKPGCAIDFERKVLPSEKPTRTRFAVAKIPEGLVEIWFTTSSDQFNGRVDICDNFLRSVRSVEPTFVADASLTQSQTH